MDACEDALSHQVATFLQVNFAKVMWCVGNVKLGIIRQFFYHPGHGLYVRYTKLLLASKLHEEIQS